MNYLSIKDLSKSYGEKILFEGISLGLHKGEKTALIANNGTGKSTLLKIIAGKEEADGGEVVLRNGIKLGYLPQQPVFDESQTINELITGSHSKVLSVIKEYNEALQFQAENHNKEAQQRLEKASAEMDLQQAWDYERRLKQVLTKFSITRLDQLISTLSGGQKKRLALALTLLDEPDILLLDEPTNHLDIDMIEWLEKYLQQSNVTLFMVTHDRYFLDRVCNHIVEMTEGTIYNHQGNYAYFLQKKAEREEVQSVEIDKAKKLMKKELEWMRRQPKARTHKSKARIDAFYDIKKKADSGTREDELILDTVNRRMGGKILEVKKLKKSYGNIKIVNDFEYTFKKGERIGVIGKNGSGKSSFLNLLTGTESPDEGTVVMGDTIVFGYYKQDGLPHLREDQKVIEVVKEIAEVIETAKGNSMSASQFLQYFMFPPEMQYSLVENLSGGERRRLYLLTVLIKNPNFLILDEPTNDLDLITLYKLEEFLMNYKGCLLLVSHDRYFLDKLSDHLFLFKGDGKVKDFYGPYKEYRQLQLDSERAQKELKQSQKKEQQLKATEKKAVKTKLSYKEQKEYETLEKEIEELEQQKTALEEELNSGITDFEILQKLSEQIKETINSIDEKTLRWMDLEELKEKLSS
jgi:ATP-binding cassette subfamily F protein uup